MNRRLDELMQSVLDGEATPKEAAELEGRLAADAGSRTQFEENRRLFDGLRRVPKVYPPEGLVASVLANIPQNPVSAEPDDQPFVAPGVLSASSRKARGETPGTGITVSQVFQRFARGRDMNGEKGGLGGLGHRKVWIGGGIAVAAAIVAIGTGLVPPNSSETAGTIVPAQRYRAPQPTAGEVQGQPGAGGQSAPVAVDSNANAGGASSGDRGGLSGGDRGGLSGGDRGGLSGGDRGGLSGGDRGGLSAGDRGGLSAGDRGGLSAGDRGGMSAGDRGGAKAGDRGGLSAGDRGGMSAGDRGGMSAGDRGGAKAGDRFMSQ